MSELINTDALAALLSGKEVQRSYKGEWEDLTADDPVDVFFTSESFRLKPRTITINGIELPAPFEPKIGEYVYFISSDEVKGYAETTLVDTEMNLGFVQFGAWRTEAEIQQVVAALRSIFK